MNGKNHPACHPRKPVKMGGMEEVESFGRIDPLGRNPPRGLFKISPERIDPMGALPKIVPRNIPQQEIFVLLVQRRKGLYQMGGVLANSCPLFESGLNMKADPHDFLSVSRYNGSFEERGNLLKGPLRGNPLKTDLPLADRIFKTTVTGSTTQRNS